MYTRKSSLEIDVSKILKLSVGGDGCVHQGHFPFELGKRLQGA